MIELMHGDCLHVMKNIKDCSIDAVIADIPYGTTQCKWDSVIDLDLMWKELERVIKRKGVILLFGAEPFSSHLRMSNIKKYKYDWTWIKSQATGHLNAWRQPMRNTEDILVFYGKQPFYYPLLEDKPAENIRPVTNRTKKTDCYGDHDLGTHKCPPGKTMPKTTIKFNNAQNTVHPTQKPADLMEYLIKTYTFEGEIVLDFTMGSGTTGVACKNLNRDFIGIELDKEYFEIAKNRIESILL